ncbi:MAG: S24 family peptidase, partial [Candidatus Aenigmatarchaeota archaeon]
ILGAVPCNNPDPNIETYMLGEYEVKKSIVKGKKEDYFVLKATSDSMIYAGIKEGDVLIVKRQQTAEDGDIVIAWVEGEGVTCKRLRKTKTETYLEPANDKYKPIKNKNFVIYGKVIYKEGKV